MNRHALLINDYDVNKVKSILKERKIPFTHAGFPNGQVKVTESYASKINAKEELSKFAIFKGYKSLDQAIDKAGWRTFRKQYEKAINLS
jgi:hypothetical protein